MLRLEIGKMYIYTADNKYLEKEIVEIIGITRGFNGHEQEGHITYKVIKSSFYEWREGLTYTRNEIYFGRVYSRFSSNNIKKIS